MARKKLILVGLRRMPVDSEVRIHKVVSTFTATRATYYKLVLAFTIATLVGFVHDDICVSRDRYF